MDAEKKMVAIFIKLCHSFLKEVGMPSEALDELLSRVTSTTTTSDLQAFQPLLFWKYVYASFYALEQKMAIAPFNKPQIPDLNHLVPHKDEVGPSRMLPMQDPDAKSTVEVQATTTKRKAVHQACQSEGKRFKGGGEIDITPIERSLEGLNIQNELRPKQESKVLPTISETQYPSHLGGHHNHQFSHELSTAAKTPFPTADKSHDQHLPHLSSEIKTQYPSAGSHDQFVAEFSNTLYPPIKIHDQNLTEESHSTVQYPSTEGHKFSAETIPRISNIYEQNVKILSFRHHQEQTQPPYEATENPSSQSSYTDKIFSATSAIADKAITAKNVVASKLGYSEKDDKTKGHEENISSDTPSNQSSYTEKISSATLAIADKAVSAKNTVASKLGYRHKGDSNEETQRENAASTSTAEYGKRIAHSLTDKLAPVYGKVAGVGSAVKSKVPGTSTGSENDKGWSVKDYFAERLRPQDEDRALSKVISETLHHKRNQEEENVVHGEAENHVKRVVSDAVHMRGEEEGEEEHERRKKISMGKVRESEEVKRRLGSGNEETERYEECYVNSPGKSVVDKVKDVVFGSWFTKPYEDQPSEGGEQFSKNSGAVAMDQG
ncbi:hypothetical protein Ahy_A05g021992 isoform B [Arachis hypogaea]|uniref:LTI65/LTI78 PGEED repeat domain-containing protein n=1 Tax=Arachis hypogaea TaxID=3818 RepID=A0A445CZ70_ARAHY|nr:hypothetical protein Ahy_A05g021992 isoform B [Arachis hypogaea]